MRRPAAFSPWTLFVLLLVSGCDNDPLPGPSAPTAPTPPALAGTVINRINDAPVAGAVVRIGDVAVTTGADGRYQFEELTVGEAMLRCSAPGYQEFTSDITVTSGTVFLDIALTRIEVFELGDFALYVPAGMNVIRGVILALGGPNTKAFTTRDQPFGAPVPETEASLQTLGESFRTMAAARGLAILGTSLSAMANGSESDQLILNALRTAEEASGRHGLSTVPLLVYGMSGGAPQATGFTSRHPERVVGLFLKVPQSVTALTSEGSLRVPTLMVLAELDAFVDNAALTAAFEANRRAGGLWAMVRESGVPHHSLSLSQRLLTLAWMRTVLEQRMPSTLSGPPRDLAESAGWLGDPATGDVSFWFDYPGDRTAASWLPSQEAAEWWQFLADIEHAPQPGGPYTDVSGVYDLTGVVTFSDGWGYEGTQITSVLTIRHFTDRPRFGGTFESVLWTAPDGQSEAGPSGSVSGSIDTAEHVVMDLLIEGNEYASRYEGTLTDGRIEGTFWAGLLAGTFVAKRRPL
jgi:Carboxypeptidase regulatory-like domain